ncbi:MAG: hypothetical protein QOF97_1725 [Acidimicrobiaceae bacterium]|jgi:hypothetical protein
MQTAVGLVCVALGCLHFVDRGRTPHARSFYFGSVRTSHTFRAVLAVTEVLCGFALLFTA